MSRAITCFANKSRYFSLELQLHAPLTWLSYFIVSSSCLSFRINCLIATVQSAQSVLFQFHLYYILALMTRLSDQRHYTVDCVDNHLSLELSLLCSYVNKCGHKRNKTVQQIEAVILFHWPLEWMSISELSLIDSFSGHQDGSHMKGSQLFHCIRVRKRAPLVTCDTSNISLAVTIPTTVVLLSIVCCVIIVVFDTLVFNGRTI